jgi:hypothetical protein
MASYITGERGRTHLVSFRRASFSRKAEEKGSGRGEEK